MIEFVSRTRVLFLKLLALIRWAGNASRVESCEVHLIYSYSFIYSQKNFNWIFFYKNFRKFSESCSAKQDCSWRLRMLSL